MRLRRRPCRRPVRTGGRAPAAAGAPGNSCPTRACPSPLSVCPGRRGSRRRSRCAAMPVKAVCTRCEVAEHRVAEDIVAVAGLIARVRAGLGTGRREVHQLVGSGTVSDSRSIWLKQREDRRIGADAERQRHDRDDRDKRGLEERPEGELRVDHGLGPDKKKTRSTIIVAESRRAGARGYD